MPELAGFRLTISDETAVSYVFDSGLLIDGLSESRQSIWTPTAGPDIGTLCPTLSAFVRSWIDDDGSMRFALRYEEPVFEPQPGCMLIHGMRREVAVAGAGAVLARLMRAMDGERNVAHLLDQLPLSDRRVGDALLRALGDAGVIDLSGRAAGRLLHTLTKISRPASDILAVFGDRPVAVLGASAGGKEFVAGFAAFVEGPRAC